MRVKSTPPGADVYLNGQIEGTTPFQHRMLDIAGPYALSVKKEGYEAHEQMLGASDNWVRKGHTITLTVSARLVKVAGAAEPGVEPETPPQPQP